MLTPKLCERATCPPGKTRHVLSDGRGLQLRVTPAGAKTWALFYRVSGRPRLYSLGPFPEVGLKEARTKAEDLRAGARNGLDAAALKREAREAKTFLETARAFLEARGPDLAASTLTEYRRMLAAYVEGSAVAEIRVHDLKRPELRAWLEGIARKNGAVMANRLFQLVRAVCRWALSEDILTENPAAGLKRPRQEHSRERVLSDPEVAALLGAMKDAPPAVRGAVVLLLLLGQRSAETLAMRWQDLDLESSPPRWTIPGRFRKGGRLHVVPLPPLALRVLDELRPLTGGQERVLAGVSEANAERDWWGMLRDETLAALRKRGAALERFCKHDLRRTAATGMASCGASRFTVGRVLGHKEAGVTAVYDRYAYLPEKAAALSAWSAHVERIAGERGGADVLAFSR